MKTRMSQIPMVAGILLLLFLIPVPAHAQGNVSATVTPPTVNLDYRLIVNENVTTLTPSHFVLDASNSSALVSLLQTGMRLRVPTATLDPSTFHYAATITNVTGSTLNRISENFTGTVSGAMIGGTADRPSFDLSFLRMSINDSFQLGGVELNKIGSAYLVSGITSQGSSTTFYLDKSLVRGGPYLNSVIPGNTTSNFNLFDFTWVPKVSDWKTNYQPLDDSASFTLNPKTDSPGLPYNLTMGVKSPEQTFLTSLVAVFDPTLEISAPARATASGYSITYDLPSAIDLLMPVIIIIIVGLLIVTLFYERRVSKPTTQFKRRDQRPPSRK